MEKELRNGLVLMAATIAGHLLSVAMGLYGRGIPVDKAWHLMAGASYVLFGLYLTGRRLDFWNASSFALFGSFAWELLEFGFMELMPLLARGLGTISPNVGDLLTDVLFGFLGGTLVLWFER